MMVREHEGGPLESDLDAVLKSDSPASGATTLDSERQLLGLRTEGTGEAPQGLAGSPSGNAPKAGGNIGLADMRSFSSSASCRRLDFARRF